MQHNVQVVECEQRTPAWFAARAGILTATGASDMLAKPLKSGGEPACRRDLRVQLALERLTGQPAEEPGFVSAAMQRGTDMENEARAAYEAVTGTLVQEVGFVRRTDLPVGCSPDGIVGELDGGVEIKCPKSATHLGYWRNPGVVPAEYIAQVTHALYVTGAPWWDFVSYDPRFPEPLRLFIVRVRREDVDLEAYQTDVLRFLASVAVEFDEIAALVTKAA